MEPTQSIILNEEALTQIADQKRPIFILQWLRYLDRTLPNMQRNEIKEVQKKIVEQLLQQIQNSPGPSTRHFLARSMATLFSVGDTFLLFDAVNRCNDIMKNKDDSPSYMSTKLAAIACIGEMYEKLGRIMGRSYEETTAILLKMLKSAESQTRIEIYVTLRKIISGMGAAASASHRDIFKALRHGLTDRVMPVRAAAANCLQELIKQAVFLYTTEMETVCSLCFRALEGSNYEVRCAVADVLGNLVALTQHTPQAVVGKNRLATADEMMGLLASGFLKGGIGFLKGGATEMIKGTSTVSREVRVGVTHAYVTMIGYLGNAWLEKNMSLYLSHLLELLVNPKAVTSHMDAVYSRRCVSFVLGSVLGRQLSEKAQCQAVKELISIINRYMSTPVSATEAESSKEISASELQAVQHVLVCSLTEIGALIERLGTSSITILSEPALGVIDTIFSVLTHPVASSRLAAAWCLRCISVAVPSQLTPLIERSLERLETMKSSADTIYGYSAALAALLGAASQTPLGIPHNKGKLIFNIAEDLLRSASQNSRLSLQRTQAGWLLIGAVMTLGPPVVRGLLPRMLLLWKNSFPRSTKELDSEKARGDSFTWQVTLENRAGALSAICSFLAHCNKLLNDEVIRRLLTPIESAINMLTLLGNVFKNSGPSVKVASVMVRLRLFEVLLRLPSESLENSYTSLLRVLVTDFTLNDTAANTTTSLLPSLCHADDDVILGSWIQESDHRLIEDQLIPYCASGSSAIEHDITSIYKVPEDDSAGPFPLGVAVIDKSCLVFAHIFRRISNKHKLQIMNHLGDCIKHAKAARQEAVSMNILAALLGALKNLSEHKITIDHTELKAACINLFIGMLSNGNAIVRCAAGQALGRCGAILNDGRVVSEIAQQCFEKVKTTREALSRTGHSFALGCLHRHAGSLGSSQHLNTTISILLALSQDNASPVGQAWALQSLTLIADSGGPMFNVYGEPILQQCQRLLMYAPVSQPDVPKCVGKLLAAVITAVGPEISSGSTSTIRDTLQLNCAIMQENGDPLVRAEAISCLQQMHMFAPESVDLASLVPALCDELNSEHLFLRRAAVACLYQLSQREAKSVADHAYNWLRRAKLQHHQQPSNTSQRKLVIQSDHGIVGIMFSLLDRESDDRLRTDTHKTINCFSQTLTALPLYKWISLFKEVLTSSDSTSALSSPDKDGENDEADDDDQFKAAEQITTHTALPAKWPTKVCAAQTLFRIILTCENSSDAGIHFDLSLARARKRDSAGKEDYLILHLSDLIRMTFMAATSESDALRLEGLKSLQLIIDKFSKVPEPEFLDHVILEQYQAQVGAALRPAFSPDTPSHVTAMACQVCSTWICSGVARDLNDLRRVHQLLVSSLAKLQKESSSRLYNEAASTLEKLAILKAWAEVYVVAMEQEQQQQNKVPTEGDEEDSYDGPSESLLHLVLPELRLLSSYWFLALKDHALLTLPTEFGSQLPHDGGTFYSSDTIEMSRVRYRDSWPQILHAAALWLCANDFRLSGQAEGLKKQEVEVGDEEQPVGAAASNSDSPSSAENEIEKRNGDGGGCTSAIDNFHLLFGITLEALCNPRAADPLSNVIVCLRSLQTIFRHPLPRNVIATDKCLAIELCNVLHRLLITRDSHSVQRLVLEIATDIAQAYRENLETEKKKVIKEIAPANQRPDEVDADAVLSGVGEGGDQGDIVPGQSLIYALLEICMCLMVRTLPELSPALADAPGSAAATITSTSTTTTTATDLANHNGNKAGQRSLTEESCSLISLALNLAAALPELCTAAASATILPSVLFLITGVLRETSSASCGENVSNGRRPINAVRECLQRLCRCCYASHSAAKKQWVEVLQSGLARVLDLFNSSDERVSQDRLSALLVIGLFITEAPVEVCVPPNLAFPCINLLRQCLLSEDPLLQVKTLQTLVLIFRQENRRISVPYIQSLAPRVVESLIRETTDVSSISNEKYNIIMNQLAVLETLIEIVEQGKKFDLLVLYVPILINLLIENTELLKMKSPRTALHSYALQKLIAIGPLHPQSFRQIISQVPSFRTRLESAIRNQNTTNLTAQNGDTIPTVTDTAATRSTRNDNPMIKLKTDFSNFT